MLKSIVALVVLAVCSNVQAASRTLYAFQAKECGACKEMEPVLKKLERKGYNVVRIDVETTKGRALAKRYKVTHVPTFITVDKQGREQGREVGVVSEGVLIALLKIAKFIVIGLFRLFIM